MMFFKYMKICIQDYWWMKKRIAAAVSNPEVRCCMYKTILDKYSKGVYKLKPIATEEVSRYANKEWRKVVQ